MTQHINCVARAPAARPPVTSQWGRVRMFAIVVQSLPPSPGAAAAAAAADSDSEAPAKKSGAAPQAFGWKIDLVLLCLRERKTIERELFSNTKSQWSFGPRAHSAAGAHFGAHLRAASRREMSSIMMIIGSGSLSRPTPAESIFSCCLSLELQRGKLLPLGCTKLVLPLFLPSAVCWRGPGL